MSFEISWYRPKRVIRVKITGQMELDEIRTMLESAQQLISEGIAPVHVLLDDADGERPPVSLSQLKALMPDLQDNVGWIIGIGDTHPIAMYVIPLLMKVLRVDFARYQTIDEGMAFLKRQDLTLTDTTITQGE